MTISIRNLMYLYLIIPISLFVIWIDVVFLNSSLQITIPKSPNNIYLFTLFFILPHIIGSSITLIDKEYIAAYKTKLGYSVILSLIFAIAFSFILPHRIYLMLFGLMTLYHVIGQQLGLTAAFSGARGRVFKAWKWWGLLTAVSTSFLIYIPEEGGVLNYHYLRYAIIAQYFVLFTLTYLGQKQSTIPNGKKYFWLNFVLIFSVFVCVELKYVFFAILIPRVIHDLTAFNFYIAHDYNRNKSTKHNIFYKILNIKKPFIMTPLLAIIIAVGINTTGFFTLIMFLTLFHYCTESFMWKGLTPHRKNIDFS